MAYEYGRDTRIKVGDGATPTEAFNTIGGETSTSFKRSSDKVDLSSKDDGIYKSASFAQQEITFSVSGKVNLPDAGFSALVAASKASPPEINTKLMKGSTVRYSGRCGVGNLSIDYSDNGAATWSCDLTNIGVPTTDNLVA